MFLGTTGTSYGYSMVSRVVSAFQQVCGMINWGEGRKYYNFSIFYFYFILLNISKFFGLRLVFVMTLHVYDLQMTFYHM